MATLKYHDSVSGSWISINTAMGRADADARYVKPAGATMTGALVVVEPTQPSHVASKGYVDSQVPVGTIVVLGSTTAPDGWLLCQGQSVSRTTYADLYAVIGTAYGTGDGSTTFTLPNLMTRTIVGLNSGDGAYDSRGDAGGADTHTLTKAEMPNKTGVLQWHNAADRTAVHATSGAFSGSNVVQKYANPQYEHTGASSIGVINFSYGGSGGSHPNLMPYAAMHYAIRT